MSLPDLPAPFVCRGEHLAIDLAGAGVLFTTRRGGVSAGPYASLNLGLLTDDAPAAVTANRDRVATELQTPLSFVHQVHGVDLREVDDAERGDGAVTTEALPRADGQLTTTPGVGLATLTADCLPVAVSGAGGVAMIHAGWRGLAAGILARGVQALRARGISGPLSAAIGPGAGGCCYEVGDEVHAAFADEPAHVHRGRNLDLPAVARARLARAGVDTVHDSGLCTICSAPDLFFSHRRDHGVTGRQAGVAWLT